MTKKPKKKDIYDWEGLNFPVFKEPLPGPPILSMDEYYQFVLNIKKMFPDHNVPGDPPASARFSLV